MPLDDSAQVVSVQVPSEPTVLTIQVPGIQGAPGVFNFGTITTGAPGTVASSSITLDGAGVKVLNLTIPRGDTGHGAPSGGAAGSVVVKNSATDYDFGWSVPTSSPTPSTLVQRDANGRVQMADPSGPADVATKSYVDTKTTIRDTGWMNLAAYPGWTVRGGFKYRVRDGICYVTADLSRTGGDLAAGGPSVIGVLPYGARPMIEPGFFTTASTLNVIFGEVQFYTNGNIQLFGSIVNNNVITFSSNFPVD